jgi:hypothetical protein
MFFKALVDKREGKSKVVAMVSRGFASLMEGSKNQKPGLTI